MFKCESCQAEVESDGYGELIHVETAKYGCTPNHPRGGTYPVAV